MRYEIVIETDGEGSVLSAEILWPENEMATPHPARGPVDQVLAAIGYDLRTEEPQSDRGIQSFVVLDWSTRMGWRAVCKEHGTVADPQEDDEENAYDLAALGGYEHERREHGGTVMAPEGLELFHSDRWTATLDHIASL